MPKPPPPKKNRRKSLPIAPAQEPAQAGGHIRPAPRTKWVVAILAAVAAVGLLSTVFASKTLRDAIARLSDSEDQLLATGVDAQESIDEWYAAQEEFLIKSARQSPPSRDGAQFKAEYKRVFSRFIKNRHFNDTLPLQAASAHYRLGQLQSLEGNNTAAIKSLKASIEIAQQQGDAELVALATNSLGCVYSNLCDYPSALHQFTNSSNLFSQMPSQGVMLAISYRNLAAVNRTIGRDGIPAIQRAVGLLESETRDPGLSIPGELLIDTRMTLCEMLWSQGRLPEARKACDSARADLVKLLEEIQDANIDTDIAALNRYRNAIHFADRNLKAIDSASSGGSANNSSDSWQWQRLVNLITEIVPDGLTVAATMTAEFEQQAGLAVAWGMYDWSQEVVAEIVRLTHDRLRFVILADNDESLDEAQSTLAAMGIPKERIRFGICNFESPWFRDMGPIVGRSQSGNWIWFDSLLTRESQGYREVTDALPKLICRNWNARVAPTSLHIEGGAVLSNGSGLTLCSSTIYADNNHYGFDAATIEKELRRVTGAKTIVPIQPLHDEPTGHLDLFMTFTDPGTVVVSESRDPQSPNRKLLNEVATTLGNIKAANLNVVRVPLPDHSDGVIRSYTNVIFANGLLLVPSYAAEMDAEVRTIYQRLLPDWQIEFIDCNRLAAKGGALHCLVSNLGDTPYTPMPIRMRTKTVPVSQNVTANVPTRESRLVPNESR
ncbi:MAG: agmatine deiminase family protein [Planctomycetales bacterium]|nr:agmatine deiminase family protein [Planctomycetales bacterium]